MYLNLENAVKFVEIKMAKIQPKVDKIHEMMHSEDKPSDYLGWLELPIKDNQDEINQIKKVAEYSSKRSFHQ